MATQMFFFEIFFHCPLSRQRPVSIWAWLTKCLVMPDKSAYGARDELAVPRARPADRGIYPGVDGVWFRVGFNVAAAIGHWTQTGGGCFHGFFDIGHHHHLFPTLS